jgi:hypothetical protein
MSAVAESIFYQKIRIGRRVISIIWGRDILALLVETEVEQSRIENLRDKLTKATGEKSASHPA